MHPNELKNRALVAAVSAELDGFLATAEALRQLASACSAEAMELTVATGKKLPSANTLQPLWVSLNISSTINRKLIKTHSS